MIIPPYVRGTTFSKVLNKESEPTEEELENYRTVALPWVLEEESETEESYVFRYKKVRLDENGDPIPDEPEDPPVGNLVGDDDND
jgi:hypothetical protein